MVICAISSMPAPMGPRQISTITSPGLIDPLLMAATGPLGDEDACRAGHAVDAVFVDHRGIDRRALDDRSLRREIAARKADGAGQSARPRLARVHDHVVG